MSDQPTSDQSMIHLRDFPKDPRKNLAWRREILKKARFDMAYRAKVKELFHRDPLFAFNGFFFTLDVRKRPLHNQPFCTYPFQDVTILELVDHINRGEDLPIEKSRDMGASWMIIAVFVWFWLDPRGGADFLLGSRIEDYVDKKGDMRTLMEKARYLIYKLPDWLRPKNFSRKKHDNFMRLTNPETGASITGESNNANFSTGGRYLAILYDEFAKWESTDRSAWTAGGDATPCRIPNSTPFGAAGQHYDLVTSGKKKIVMHWSKHPEKAEGLYCVWPKPEEADAFVGVENWKGLRSPWYDKQCYRRSAVEIAQELDIDYVGAGNPVFDGRAGKRVMRLLRAEKPIKRVYRALLEEQKLEELSTVPDDLENKIVLFEDPSESFDYAIAMDVAEGKESGDYSIIKVMNRQTKSCVATIYTCYDETYATLILRLIWDLFTLGSRRPWWAVETTGLGLTVFDQATLIHGMTNAFMMPTYDSARQSVSYRKGWWTSSSSKNVLIGDFKDWLVEGAGWVDPRCIREITTFVRDKNGKPKAKEGCNDDEVMAWGICLQVDRRCPLSPRKEEQKLDEQGLPKGVFEGFKKVKEPTIEERCLEQALKNLPLLQARSHPLIDFVP
jgi:hypothetical protein